MLSVFITPWMKPTNTHEATRRACRATTSRSRVERRGAAVRQMRGMAGNREADQPLHQLRVALGPRKLEGAHPQVAGSHPREHRPRHAVVVSPGVAPGAPTRRRHREGTRGRNAQRVHRLTHQVLAQHRPNGGEAVAARRRGAARTLQMQIAQFTPRVSDLAEQQGSTITEQRRVPAELMRLFVIEGVGVLRGVVP